jgi:predicted PurR-regulated permease PerM
VTPERRLTLGDMPWRATLPIASALFVGLGALWGVRYIARPIGFLVIAVAIAEALAPPVARLEKHVPRGIAIAGVFLLLAASLVGVGWLVVPPLVTQGQELVVRAPELGTVARRYLEQGNAAFGLQVDALLASLTRQVGGFLLTVPLRAFAAFVNVVLLLFLSAYWLVGAPALERFALTLVPARRRPAAAQVLGEMGQAMGGYVRGAAINAVIMGVLAGAGLWFIDVRYPVVLGAVTMLLEPVPIVGPVLAAVPVVLVALSTRLRKRCWRSACTWCCSRSRGSCSRPTSCAGRPTCRGRW